MIRVVIADGHAVVREGLRHVLTEDKEVSVVGEASNGDEVSAVLQETLPDVLLLELSMPGQSGMDLLRHLKEQHPMSRVLVLTRHGETQYIVGAFRAGASGYLTKDSTQNELLDALRRVAAGGTYVHPDVADSLAMGVHAPPRDLHADLSDRELEVLRRVVNGETLTEIAVALSISTKTVSTYKMRLFEMLQLRSDAALVRYALEKKLFPDELPPG